MADSSADLTDLTRRVSVLERQMLRVLAERGVEPVVAPRPAPRPAPVPPGPGRPVAIPAPEPFDWRESLPSVTSAQVLAWVGGAVTLLGILFFFILAAQHGLFTPPLRLGLGTLVSLGLLGFALRIHRREGRMQAALAAAATGVAGLYTTLLAATSLYGYVDRPVALLLAGGIAGLAVVVALVMDAESLAGFGIVTAMLAPVAVQVGEITTTGTAFVAVMAAAGLALLVSREWHRQLLACVAVSAPQAVLLPLADVTGPYHGGATLLILAAVFAGVYLAAAFVHGLRPSLRLLDFTSSTPTLAAASVVTVAIIRGLNGEVGGISLEGIGLLGAGAAFAAAALVPRLVRRPFTDLSDLMAAIALAYAAAGCGEVFAGQSLVIVWSAEGAALALAARRIGKDRLFAPAVAYLGLAVGDAVAFQAPLADLLTSGPGLRDGLVSLGAALAGLTGMWIALRGRREQPVAAWAALALLAYAGAETLAHQWLVLAWAGAAVVLVAIADRARRSDVHLHAGAFLVLATVDAVGYQAPPAGLATYGAGTASTAGWMSLAACAAGAAVIAVALRFGRARERAAADAALVAATALTGYLTAAVLGGQWLVAAWAAEAAAMAVAGRLLRERAFMAAGAGLLIVAAIDTLALQSRPSDLFVAGPHPAAGLPSVVAVAAAAAAFAWATRREPEWPAAAWATAAAAVYAGTVALLGAAEALPGVGASSVDIRSAFKNGHTAVSAFWALTGLGVLYGGLRRQARGLYAGGFVLLALALAKIFLYDLAYLDSLTRAGSFVAVGTTLLLGALVVQRLAPRLIRS
ncbi:MAG TPA: DUF2339 domain-containing protein [Gaiellales bacterium]|nr:DUF2339 domain-containing protein [Gaiellales bacterium]